MFEFSGMIFLWLFLAALVLAMGWAIGTEIVRALFSLRKK